MAALGNGDKSTLNSHIGMVQMYSNDSKKGNSQEAEKGPTDYTRRAQWLQAAVLGANNGLLTVASLMMGVGSVKKDVKAMLLPGIASLVGEACSMAIREFVSVYTQYDVKMSQMKRDKKNKREIRLKEGECNEKVKLPSPVQAAVASALAFSVGALVLLVGAAFITDHKVRLIVTGGVACVALSVFEGMGSVLGKTAVGRSCCRVVAGRVMAMSITFGLTKLVASTGLQL